MIMILSLQVVGMLVCIVYVNGIMLQVTSNFVNI